MRSWSRSPLVLIVLVLVPSLAIYAHSSGILDRARELFAQQRYAELVAEMRALPAEELDAAGVEARYTLLVGELRLAKMRGDSEAGAAAARELDALARAFPDSDWPARITAERLRAMSLVSYPEAQGSLNLALSHWEDHRDVPLATGEYLALLDVLLADDVYIGAPFTRMWRNLMRVAVPRERMLELGAQLLGSASRREDGGLRRGGMPWQIYSRSGDARELQRVVATDVLAMEPEGWLEATAELRLGEIEREQMHFPEAVAHFERAVAAADASDSADAQTAQRYLNELRAPQISISGAPLHRPDSTPQLSIEYRNLRSFRLRVQRLDPLRDAKTGSQTNGQDSRGIFPAASGDRVFQRDFDVAQSAAYEALREQQELKELPVGLYLCEASAEAKDETTNVETARFVLQIGRIGVVAQPITRLGHGGLEFWVVDMESGLAQPNVNLELRTADEHQVWRTQQLRTDANGLARTEELSDARVFLLLGAIGQEAIFFQSSMPHVGARNLGRETVAHILTDRPLYRPGERVHLSAVLRERDLTERKVNPPRRDRVELVLSGADGNELHRESLPVDRDGFLEGEFELPNPAPLGAAQLRLSWGKDESPFGYATIQIEEIRLPEFRVRVEVDDDQALVAGDSLRAHIAAEYLWGGPVQGMATIVVSRQPRWFHPLPYWQSKGRGVAEAKIMPWPQQRGEELQRETVALDAEGRAYFAFATRADGGVYEYRIESSVTDDSRREERGSASIPVGLTEFQAQLHPSRWVTAPNDEIELTFRFADLRDRGVATSGKLRIVRMTEKEEQLEERFVRSDAEGNGSLRYRPQLPGHYRFELSAQDRRNNPVSAETSIWCADPKQRLIVQGSGGLTLVAEQDDFGDDQVAKVLVISDVPDAQVYLTLADGAAVTSQLLHLSGSVKLVEIALDDMHRPRFSLRAHSAHDFRMQSAELTVEAPLAAKRLQVSAEFARADYRPGDTAELRIRVLDALGKPARLPFSIAVIDASILAVVPRSLADPVSVFHEFWTQPIPWPLVSAEQRGGYRQELAKNDQERQSGELHDGRDEKSEFRRDSLAQANETDYAVAGLASGKVNAPAALEEGLAPVELRTDFRTTALWQTLVQSDEDGTARVEFRLPESLTEWNALAVGIDRDTRAGTAEATTRTRKPLMVRLAHPRIFRERDRLLLSAIVHNESEREQSTTVRLSAEGLSVEGGAQTILVPAGGERRLQWWAHAPAGSAELRFERDHLTNRLSVREARCLLRVEAQSADESDGLERYVDLHPYGTPLRVTTATRLSAAGKLDFNLPDQRAQQAETATLTLSPSVLSACIDALPYLASYPYGCVEQTLSRFVPAVAVRAAVRALGASSKRIDPELDAKLAQGLARIAELQRPDGSFGWWSGGEADPYMTAYAIVALQEARDAGVRVSGGTLDRAREALRSLLPQLEARDDDMAYALFALSPRDEDETMRRHADRLFAARDQLNDSARALLALHEQARKRTDRAEQLVAHLRNTAIAEPKLDTMHWGKARDWTWRWDGAVEATSFALRAYLAVEPDAPEADRAARWLVAQRNGARWNSTRDTAHAIFALVRYAQNRGELAAEYELVARLAGVDIARMRVNPDDLLDSGGSFTVDPALLRDGANSVEFAFSSGNGVCYASMSVESFTSTLRPAPTARQVEVRREIVRLRPASTLGGRIIHFEAAFADGDSLASGERLRVRLHVNALTDLEYMAIEDPRPSGLEAVDTLSGWDWNGSLGLRREQQEDRTAFFVARMPQGEHVIEYDLRAETPGRYHGMPALAYAMYVPEISASSELYGLGIVDAPGELPAP